MKISLVIPTRERARYLASCLETALRVEDPDLEIVVSDNHSQDATAEVVAARSDPRVRYIRTPARCSMRGNYEHVLAAASGDYVILVGDDDGVLPSGMAHLRALLERERPEIVAWRVPRYLWPLNEQHPNGCATIRFPVPFRRSKQKPSVILRRLCAARVSRWSNYSDTSVYHCCVAREVIERARVAQGGVYCRGAFPDLYACFVNLWAMSDRPLSWLGHPATFNGISPRSTGLALGTLRKMNRPSLDEVAAFSDEVDDDKGSTLVGTDILATDALALDMLDMALAGRPEHDWIDWAAWLRRIRRQIAAMPREKHTQSAAAFEAYCQAKGLSDMLNTINAQLPFRGPETVADVGIPPQTSIVELRKIELAHPVELADTVGAATVIEAVLDRRHPVHGTRRSMGASSVAGRYAKWFGATRRARRIAERWQTQASEAS